MMPPISPLSSRLLARTVPTVALSRAGRQAPTAAASAMVRRWNSTKPSQYTAFFKTFGRPISKVCLMAIFAYQLAFFTWSKLEQDDIRAERQGTIDALEAHVKELKAAKKA